MIVNERVFKTDLIVMKSNWVDLMRDVAGGLQASHPVGYQRAA